MHRETKRPLLPPANAFEGFPTTLVERAYELALSGECEFVYQIERRLAAEGFSKGFALSKNAELRTALRVCLAPHRRPSSGSHPR
jgi:hypothetical protein